MGADFLGLILRIPDRGEPNFTAGRRAVNALTLGDVDASSQLMDRVADEDETDPDNEAATLAALKTRLRTCIEEFQAQWPLGREWDSFRIGGMHLLVTGGMSWGDSPTALWEALRDLLDTPTVLEAMDCGSDLNPTNPVTVASLRSDWDDDPHLSEATVTRLQALPDTKLQAVLDAELDEAMWFQVLDGTRGDTTRALLRELGLPDQT